MNTKLTRSRFGGIGAISVYFYKFKKDEKLNDNKDRVQKVEVPESIGIGIGMKISTVRFWKSKEIKMASNKMLRSALNKTLLKS